MHTILAHSCFRLGQGNHKVCRPSAPSLRGHHRHGSRDEYGAVDPMLDWSHMMARDEARGNHVECCFGRSMGSVDGSAKEADA